MHLAIFLNGIAQLFPVIDNFAVNEYEDVLAQSTPFIHHITAESGVMAVNALQEVGKVGTADFRIFQARKKAAQGISEFYSRHSW